MEESKAAKPLNWVTLEQNVKCVAMLASPVATDQGVADMAICVDPRRDGRWAVFLTDSINGPAIGGIEHTEYEFIARGWAETLASRWPPADPAQIASLSAKRSISAKKQGALYGCVTGIAGVIVLMVIILIVMAIGWAVSPQLTVGAFVALVIGARVMGRRAQH